MKIIRDVIEGYFTNAHGLGKFVLDIGTGSANMALTLADMGIRCVTIEKSENAFKLANTNIQNSSVRIKPFLLNMDARGTRY